MVRWSLIREQAVCSCFPAAFFPLPWEVIGTRIGKSYFAEAGRLFNRGWAGGAGWEIRATKVITVCGIEQDACIKIS